MAPVDPQGPRGNWLLGAIFIAVGAILLVGNFSPVGVEAVVLVIGLVFLFAYATQRQAWALIPGGILTGLGAGILADTATGAGGSVVLGLGLGFLLVYVVGALGRSRWIGWWPVIPGGILTFVGLSDILSAYPQFAAVWRFWPVLIILAGLFLLYRQGTRAV